jgi:hypothetical protein
MKTNFCASIIIECRIEELRMLWSRIAPIAVLLSAIFTWSESHAAISAGPAPAKGVEALLKQSRAKRNSKRALQYEDQFLKALEPTLLPAMKTCTSKTPDTVNRVPLRLLLVLTDA